ncbi:putative NAD(P)H nitroreductase [Pedobacter glucosidilyticus]|uniref:NAD(P)H-dependent oxidoreductase n=1 Tax=Pedobacter aquae TaxID=2605747 RepID=A0A5C0VIU8_9SPHI|nr:MULTISPECIES: NAD(P)H-dependent oxidoreductase [Pedobacter]KHJ36678.1 putative NAD(P)H nitroreductase [Pedobacter glucosidilyticus]QEK52436.1 NAD(P)H-dependent oxidoreductase [Pedobacter aquae]
MNAQNIIDKLNWRYATKAFDASRKLSAEQLEHLLSAVQLAPSSYGLQPYKVLVVSNPEVREKLKAAAYNQTQITDASEIIVFATYKDFNLSHVDDFANNIVATRGITKADIQGYIDVMNGAVSSRDQQQLQIWNTRQAYIGLGILLETAALLDIDACPMEGFSVEQFDDILGLSALNLTSVVVTAVGYRSAEDGYQHYKKVRKSKEDLFIKI